MVKAKQFMRRSRSKGSDEKGAISVMIRQASKDARKGAISRHVTVADARVSDVHAAITKALFDE